MNEKTASDKVWPVTVAGGGHESEPISPEMLEASIYKTRAKIREFDTTPAELPLPSTPPPGYSSLRDYWERAPELHKMSTG